MTLYAAPMLTAEAWCVRQRSGTARTAAGRCISKMSSAQRTPHDGHCRENAH